VYPRAYPLHGNATGGIVYVEAMDVRTEALEIRIGARPTSDLPRIAANAVAGGSSSVALRELAALIGLPREARAAAVERLSRDALGDLGVFDLARDAAAEQLIRRYARQIVDGDLAPVDGAANITNAIVEMGWQGAEQPLWDEGTGDIYQASAMYFDGPQPPSDERVQMIEAAIVDTARRLMHARRVR
jgi:hypothetical protein